MKPLLSPLILLDFAILNSNFEFIPPSENFDNQNLFIDYNLDFDFAINHHKETTRVFIKVLINQQETQLPGYSIFAEGVAMFNLSKEASLSEEDKSALLQYSAVSIAINSLRGFIVTLTANAPFGRYLLPSIDVNNLFQQKAKVIQKKAKVEKKK